MSRYSVTQPADRVAAPPRWTRVLMLRSCRMPQFQAALARVQREHPGVAVVALAPRQFHDELRAAGVPQVIDQRSSRLTIARLGLRTIRRLRALSPDAVIIPTADVALRSSVNLLWLAAVTTRLGWPAVPVMLAQMLRAAVWPGPRRAPPRHHHVESCTSSIIWASVARRRSVWPS